MPKKYIIKRDYTQDEEKKILSELNEIKKNGILIYQRDTPYIKTEYGFLMNHPNIGCFLELTYFFKNELDEERVEATLTTTCDDKPNIVKDLERILKRESEEIDVRRSIS